MGSSIGVFNLCITPWNKNGKLFFVLNRFRNAIFIKEHRNRNVIILVLLGTNRLKNNFVFKPCYSGNLFAENTYKQVINAAR